MWRETIAVGFSQLPQAALNHFNTAFTRIVDRPPTKWGKASAKDYARIE
jgi:hypothetical protein